MSLIAVSPGDRWPVENDWSDVVKAGDSIAQQLWTAFPDELTLSAPTASLTFVEGFKRGRDYFVLEAIETATGIKAARGFHFRCEDLT